MIWDRWASVTMTSSKHEPSASHSTTASFEDFVCSGFHNSVGCILETVHGGFDDSVNRIRVVVCDGGGGGGYLSWRCS